MYSKLLLCLYKYYLLPLKKHEITLTCILNDLQFYGNAKDFWNFTYISSLSLLGNICKMTSHFM